MKADKRKGQVAIVRNNDGCVALQWFERVHGDGDTFSLAEEPDVDQIIFEFEGHFEWINKDKRVLSMKFKESMMQTLTIQTIWSLHRNRRRVLQEPDTKWDDELLLRANKAINGHDWTPPVATPSTTPAAPAPAQSSSATHASVSQPTTTAPHGLPLNAGGQLFDMNQLVAGMQARLQQQQAAAGPSLSEVLTPDAVSDFVKLPGMLDALREHLPPQHRTQEQLEALPRTAQFLQQLQGFSTALRTGKLDVTQFGLQPKGTSTVDFLEAIQALVDAEKGTEEGKKDDESAAMDT